LAKNVHAIIGDLRAGLSELQSHFESLGSIFGGRGEPSGRTTPRRRRRASKARPVAKRSASAPRAARKTRRKPRLSPAVRAQRRLQGKYMAKFKTLPKARQVQVRKVRAEKGYEAALKMMA